MWSSRVLVGRLESDDEDASFRSEKESAGDRFTESQRLALRGIRIRGL